MTTRRSTFLRRPGTAGRGTPPGRRTWRALAALAVLVVAVAATTARTRAQFIVPTMEWDRWMGALFDERPAAADQALSRFVFPGSHDAGTYELLRVPACEGCTNSSFFVDPVVSCQAALPDALDSFCQVGDAVIDAFGLDWGQTQSLTVGQQLQAGARAFDLRFFRATADDVARSGGVLVEGNFYIHHGLAGERLDTILDDIDAFLADARHKREVIIIDFRFLKEGAGDMSDPSRQEFYTRVRNRIGSHMAPRQDPACATDPTCVPTRRFGAGATVAELLGQGHQVIVNGPGSDPDIWSSGGADPFFEGGYPTPDDVTHPWISDQDVFTLIDGLSQTRDGSPSSELFMLGVHIGLDNAGMAIMRSLLCEADPENVGGRCPAVNSDWDEFSTVKKVAAYTNPRSLAALAGLRRDRVNVVLADDYTPAFTEEAYKLNAGATKVETRIKTVRELDRHDATTGPDYYPVFRYPGSTPLPWINRIQRNIQEQNVPEVEGVVQIAPEWPGWKAFLNSQDTGRVTFQIVDAEGVGDDTASRINSVNAAEGEFAQRTDVVIAGCVQDPSRCRTPASIFSSAGSGSDSSRVTFSFDVCVWSWLLGDAVDPASVCSEPAPTISVYGVSREEGNAGTTPFDFTVLLSAPSASPVTVSYKTSTSPSATSGVDYTPIDAGTLTFAPGETRKVITVDVAGDTSIEATELIYLSVTAADLNQGSILATGTILNDDTTPTLSIANTAVDEGATGQTTQVTFTVSLGSASTEQVTVRYATTGGTATSGVDYVPVSSGLLTFAPGSTTKTFTIQVAGDTSVEADETIFVTLSEATGAFLPVAKPECGCSAIATIRNDDVAGTMTAPGNQAASEGASRSFALGTLVDTRAAGPWSVAVNWGDGQAGTFSTSTAGAISGTHAYADNGTYAATVSVADVDGISAGTVTFGIDVSNVAPTATLANSGPVDEGFPVTLTLNGPSDPSPADTAAGFRYTFACDGGSLDAATYATGASSPSTTCTFTQGGTRTTRGRIIDRDGGFTESTTLVTVNDVRPILGVPALQTGLEGTSATLSLGALRDPGDDGPWTIAVNWGDGGSESLQVAATGALAGNHRYADNGEYLVTVTATDVNGVTSDPISIRVRIDNAAPAVTATGSAVVEGGLATVSGTIADPGLLDSFLVTVNWGDGSTSQHPLAAGVTTWAFSHQYLDDNPTATPSDLAAVSVTVVDKDGGRGTASTSVRVDNVTPVVTSLQLTDETGATPGATVVALTGLPVSLEATLADLGVQDVHVATIAWGDGSTSAGTMSGSGGVGTVRGSHTWSTPGTFVVRVDVVDDDTGVGSREVTVTLVGGITAVCAVDAQVAAMASAVAPGTPTATALQRLRDQIIGNREGLAANGACDRLEGRQYTAGVRALVAAVDSIETIRAIGGLDASQQAALRLVEARLVLTAKWTYGMLAASATDAQKLATAARLASQAEAATAAGAPASAIDAWWQAVRLLAPEA